MIFLFQTATEIKVQVDGTRREVVYLPLFQGMLCDFYPSYYEAITIVNFSYLPRSKYEFLLNAANKTMVCIWKFKIVLKENEDFCEE